MLLSLVVFTCNVKNLQAQNELKVIYNWPYFKNAPDALYNHLASQAFEFLDKRTESVKKIKTLEDWKAKQEEIRKTLHDIVGSFPEKTPLNARITRTLQKDGFRVEHIIFESRPGFKVTSTLFIPESLKKNEKAPAIIYCSGHSISGYHSEPYQHVILNLVKKGFIVFAFDPIGQGERFQYYNPQTGKSDIIGGPPEHNFAGAQCFINGISLANYFIWDGIRAVDYLLTRKEVDPLRLGITGRSGGGTQSAYIAAMDDRIYAAAPENYLTNLTRLLQSQGPQDAEQNFFHGISKGFDHPDFLIVRAPKPTLMILTTNDMFNIQGARDTYNEVSKVYSVYGKKENIEVTEDIAPHASTRKNNEAMYAFFQKQLNNPGNSQDEDVPTLTSDEIRVTETGQIMSSVGSETVYSLNLIEARKFRANLQKLRPTLNAWLPKVIESAKNLSGYQKPEKTPQPVLTGMLRKNNYMIEKYFILGEGNYPVPYLLYVPDQLNHKAILYIHPLGKEADSSSIAQIERFIKEGFVVLSPDLLGTGETMPESGTPSNLKRLHIWYTSVLIERSIAGIRAGDVERLVNVLERYPGVSEISAIAKGSMSPVLLHAAAFCPAIRRIALIEPLSSYYSIVNERLYSDEYIRNSVPGVLRYYDLPDLAASLAPRKLIMIDIKDGSGKISDSELIQEDISIIRNGYKFKNAGSNLMIMKGHVPEIIDKLFD